MGILENTGMRKPRVLPQQGSQSNWGDRYRHSLIPAQTDGMWVRGRTQGSRWERRSRQGIRKGFLAFKVSMCSLKEGRSLEVDDPV